MKKPKKKKSDSESKRERLENEYNNSVLLKTVEWAKYLRQNVYTLPSQEDERLAIELERDEMIAFVQQKRVMRVYRKMFLEGGIPLPTPPEMVAEEKARGAGIVFCDSYGLPEKDRYVIILREAVWKEIEKVL